MIVSIISSNQVVQNLYFKESKLNKEYGSPLSDSVHI